MLKSTLHHPKAALFAFEKKILFFFCFVLAILAAIISLYIGISRETRRTKALVAQTEKVLSLSDSIVRNEQTIVIQTRGYLISGNVDALNSFAENNRAVQAMLAQLWQLAKDNPLQQKRVDSIKTIYRRYTEMRTETIRLRQREGFRLDEAAPKIKEADSALGTLNGIFDTLQAEEKQLLAQRRAAYLKEIEFSVSAIRILLLLFVVFVLLSFLVVYWNAVRRRKAEGALQKSEDLVRGLIQHAPVLVNVKDQTGKYLLVNQQFATAMLADAAKMIGKTGQEFLSLETAAAVSRGDQEVIDTGQSVELMVDLPAPDGMHTYLTSKFPLRGWKGNVYAIGSTAFDVTPLKTAHEALLQSFERQQKVLDGLQKTMRASLDLLCVINEEGAFVMVSDTARQLFGYAPKEMMNKRFMDFVVEEDRPKTSAIAAQIRAGEPVSEFSNRYRRKDGTEVPVTWSATWAPDDKMMYCIARNGSEKIKTARQLAQSEEKLLHAQKLARLGSWEWDLQSGEWACSDMMYELLGIEKTSAGNIQTRLLAAIHPLDRPQMEKARQEALLQGKKVDIEHRIIQAGKRICFMQTRGEVTVNAEGKPIWFSGTMQDITQQKLAERRMKQLNSDLEKRAEELRASNAELERFAYVASHDLQEPLRMVSSFLTLLNKRHQDEFDETSRKYVHFAVDGAERMKVLIRDLLHYSRLGSSNELFTAVDVNTVMTEVHAIFTQPLKEMGGVLRVGKLPVVTGHHLQLHQLFQNLVGNALKYRSQAPPVIDVGCTDAGKDWQFFVRDNGIGIEPKYQEKIFVIFQRLHTKNDYSGTGIGLAICKKIVERHGGRIWVESGAGPGSTFYFTLKKNTHAERDPNSIG